MKVNLLVIFCLMIIVNIAEARVLRVGAGYDYSSLNAAANAAQPGDTIMLFDSPVTQSSYISNLRGTVEKPIVITSGITTHVLFEGGGTAIQLTNASNITISRLTFRGQANNGVNIDDGGDFSTPSENITIYDCKWLGMAATGNNDNLKMSGVVNFSVRNCYFDNGAAGGSHIDMVGCHKGIIEQNEFRNGGSNSIQAKGGTKSVAIARNLFINAGLRAINIGGSTGMKYFRPLDAKAESDSIIVFSNIFFGSMAPIAYVGAINAKVINNTIVNPTKWVVRILRENLNIYLHYDNNNQFINNIVYIGNAASSPVINVGPGTVPDAYVFRNNLWYNHENENWSPVLPVHEFNSLRGVDPLLDNVLDSNLVPRVNSPVIGAGYGNNYPPYDYYGNKFNNPPSIGAIEVNIPSAIRTLNYNSISLYPNPAENYIIINSDAFAHFDVEIVNVGGQSVYSGYEHVAGTGINVSQYPGGFYLMNISGKGYKITKFFVINR